MVVYTLYASYFSCLDSVDTPIVLRHMKELVATCNVYIAEQSSPNARLLGDIAQYLTYLFRVFGVSNQDTSIGFSVEGAQAANQVRGG